MVNDWLNKPFPYIEDLKSKLLISLVAGIVVIAILVLFQPFGINVLLESIYWYLAGFGLITMVVIALLLILLPLVLPGYINTETWTIGKNILFILLMLIIISLFNFVYAQYMVSTVYIEALEEVERTGVLSWIFMTFSVGIFPVFFIIYFAERQLLYRNQRLAKEITEEISHEAPSGKGKIITLEVGKSKTMDLNTAELICIRADGGNYSTVYWHDELGNHKEILRMTLLNFLEKVNNSDNIIRCHKSYIVNLDKIENVTGNARSLILELRGVDFTIPVSRSFPREQLVRVS